MAKRTAQAAFPELCRHQLHADPEAFGVGVRWRMLPNGKHHEAKEVEFEEHGRHDCL